MTLEALNFDIESDAFCIANFALQTGLWDGRRVSWEESAAFYEQVQERLMKDLVTNPSGPFARLATQFVWAGSSDAEKALLKREMEAFHCFNQDRMIPAGFWKSVTKFWEEYKVPILIFGGAAAVAGGVTIAVIAFGSAATVTGCAEPSRPHRKDPGPKAKNPSPMPSSGPVNVASDSLVKEIPAISPSTAENLVTAPPVSFEPTCPSPLQVYEKAPNFGTNGKLVFSENGVTIGQTYASYQKILEQASDPVPLEFFPKDSTPSSQSWFTNVFETVGKGLIDPDLLNPNDTFPIPRTSSRFSSVGIKHPHLRICGINGINTSFEEANNHLEYLNRFAPEYSFDWIHNCTHSAIVDLSEAIFLNYGGLSPNTASMLKESWIQFDQENADRPNAKCLQICHSQGAIHVRNALEDLPEEIRKRVIVIAIAPAAVVSRKICFKSFNVACKGDLVPHGELFFSGPMVSVDGFPPSPWAQTAFEHHEELIFLDPDPNTKESAHSFQNPVYARRIEEQIREYLKQNGQYE